MSNSDPLKQFIDPAVKAAWGILLVSLGAALALLLT